MTFCGEPEDRFSEISFDEEATLSSFDLGNSWKWDETRGVKTNLNECDDAGMHDYMTSLVERD